MQSYVNSILTNNAREYYKPIINQMTDLCPDMMSRKIPEANVQQAFVFDFISEIYRHGDAILSVGSFEDTAYECLKKVGIPVRGIDPETDISLHDLWTDYISLPEARFDIIFSTSVIEHVRDDEQFISEICQLLKPGGYGILTTDFREDYTLTMPLPYTDLRFYTSKDLGVRLYSVLEKNGCDLVNSSSWNGEPDFHYQGHDYSFATFVFRKKNV